MTDIDIEALRARYEGHYHKTASADVLTLLDQLAAARAELSELRFRNNELLDAYRSADKVKSGYFRELLAERSGREATMAELARVKASVVDTELAEAERLYLDAAYEAVDFAQSHKSIVRFCGTEDDQYQALIKRGANRWHELLGLRAALVDQERASQIEKPQATATDVARQGDAMVARLHGATVNERPPTALAELRMVDGATGVNASKCTCDPDDVGTMAHAEECPQYVRFIPVQENLERDLAKVTAERDTLTARMSELEASTEGYKASVRRSLGVELGALHREKAAHEVTLRYNHELAAKLDAMRAVVDAARTYTGCGGTNALWALREALSALDKPATAVAEPREIRVGSTWLDRSVLGPSHSVKVETVHGDGGGVNLLKDTGWRFAMTTVAFRHAYKWLSDPDPTAETNEK